MTLTVATNEPTFKAPELTGPAWYLNRQRNAALNRQRDPFNSDAWLEALEASDLHEKVKETGHDIADSIDWYGTTKISRQELAGAAGVTRVATVTARTTRLEDAGFITTERRFNNTSTFQLVFPYDEPAPHHNTTHPEQIIHGARMRNARNLFDSPVGF